MNPLDWPAAQKLADGVRIHHLGWLHDRILPRSLFGTFDVSGMKPLENPSQTGPGEVAVLTCGSPGMTGRAAWFACPRSAVRRGTEHIDRYQVTVSSANAGGQKRSQNMSVAGPVCVFGRVRLALGSFDTE